MPVALPMLPSPCQTSKRTCHFDKNFVTGCTGTSGAACDEHFIKIQFLNQFVELWMITKSDEGPVGNADMWHVLFCTHWTDRYTDKKVAGEIICIHISFRDLLGCFSWYTLHILMQIITLHHNDTNRKQRCLNVFTFLYIKLGVGDYHTLKWQYCHFDEIFITGCTVK